MKSTEDWAKRAAALELNATRIDSQIVDLSRIASEYRLAAKICEANVKFGGAFAAGERGTLLATHGVDVSQAHDLRAKL